jgi:hypothetical protein
MRSPLTLSQKLSSRILNEMEPLYGYGEEASKEIIAVVKST